MADFTTPPTLNFGADTAAPSVPTAAPADASAAPTEKKKRTRSTTVINPDHVPFVQANIKTMSYDLMAEKLGISKSQVNSILQTIKSNIRDAAIADAKAAGASAYAQKGTNKKNEILWDWANPISDLAKKVEVYIDSDLSRPADARPGGAKGNPAMKTAINTAVSDILKNLK